MSPRLTLALALCLLVGCGQQSPKIDWNSVNKLQREGDFSLRWEQDALKARAKKAGLTPQQMYEHDQEVERQRRGH